MTNDQTTHTLSFWGLLAIVFGSMIGAGIFNIAQNMAAYASLGAVVISWVVTLFGILFLTLTFKILADRRPDLRAGIYQYAKVGFGNYIGFNVAWGYWLSAAFGNVAYVIMLNDSLGVFFPQLLDHQVPTAIFGTSLIWIMYFIVSRGFQTAALLNAIITIIKFTTLAVIVVILVALFNVDLALSDVWGSLTNLGDWQEQVKNTMMVTIWCFVGIEGASMMSARARRTKDVGRAAIVGLICAWLLYLLISVLDYGVLPQQELAQLGNPSLAYLLRTVAGDWAYYFVIFAVIISISGCWISWTLICAQVPYEASKIGLMPKRFQHLNSHDMPSTSLLITSIIIQSLILLVIMADSVYLAAITLTSVMILPSYLFSGMYLLKTSCKLQQSRWCYFTVGLITTIFCCWLIYAGGLTLLMISSILYLSGTVFYIQAISRTRHIRYRNSYRCFSRKEKGVFLLLLIFSMISIVHIIIYGIQF